MFNPALVKQIRTLAEEALQGVPNPTRPEYRELTTDEQANVDTIKAVGALFIGLLQSQPGSREGSLAITNAEQAVMWAVKAATRRTT